MTRLPTDNGGYSNRGQGGARRRGWGYRGRFAYLTASMQAILHIVTLVVWQFGFTFCYFRKV